MTHRVRPIILTVLSFVALLALLPLLASHAYATPALQATNTIDLTGQCAGGIGDVPALAVAIDTANANAADDTIVLAQGCIYTLTAANNTTALGPTGLPIITSTVIISGNDSTILRDSSDDFRLLSVDAPGDLALYDLTLAGGLAQGVDGTNGRDAGGGGGGAGAGGALLLYDGSLHLERVALHANEGRGGDGGRGGGQSNPDTAGIGGDGSPALPEFRGGDGPTYSNGPGGDSVFGGGGGGAACLGCSNNSGGQSDYGGNGSRGASDGSDSGHGGGGAGGGGAIFVYNGTLTANRVVLYDNQATGGDGQSAGLYTSPSQSGGGVGGALFNYAGDVTMTNVAFANNAASGSTGYGGSLFNYQGSLTTHNVTFGDNSISSSTLTGENIYNDLAGATLTLNNTIVAGATNAITNTAGTVDADNRNNLIQSGYSGAGVITADPLLGPFQDNLGDFPTQGLLLGSPAIDAGDNARVNGATTDLRGFQRIQYGGGNATVDIGAYELIDTAILVSAAGDADITDGETYDFGATIKGEPVTVTFTIENQSAAQGTLELGSDTVVISGTGFSLVDPVTPFGGVTTLVPGASTTFQVRADALADGTRTAVLSFNHNGTPDDVPYDIRLTAEINTPEIVLASEGTPITDSVTSLNFGATVAGTPITRTFTITNTEQPTLTVSNLSLPAEFSLVGPFPGDIGPGQADSFQLRFDAPATLGVYTGTVQFDTNDETENPFSFDVAGSVILPPDSDLVGSEIRLSDIGGLGNTDHNVRDPRIAYNATDDVYLVVWQGDETEGKDEIYGQYVEAGSGAEIGTNDFPIIAAPDTDHGPLSPAVAWNSTHNEFLVVADADLTVDNQYEIFGQRVDGSSGALVGTTPFTVTDSVGGVGSGFGARYPDVVYNATSDEYFVVWQKAKYTSNATEIWGRRVHGDRAAGDAIGSDIRISDMGVSDTDTDYGAGSPAVAWNSSANEYLVTWEGTDDGSTLARSEYEIFGQRLDAAGTEIGNNDFRISAMGPDGDSAYDAYAPDVAYNAAHDEYLATWWGAPGVPLAQSKYEIFGQRLDDAGAEVGNDDFRISDMGPDDDSSYAAFSPAVAYSALHDEYIVTWSGDDDTGTQVDNEDEIFLQRIEGDRAVGDETGANDVRVTRIGPTGDTNYFVLRPDLAFGGATDEAFLVWYGSDDEDGMALYEFEVFGRRYQIPVPSDVAITKTAEPLTAEPGEAITYTLSFTNTGPNTAIGVVITDVVPAAVTNLNVTGSGASITDTGAVPAYVWQVQDLTPGAGGVITLTGTLSDSLSADGTLTNTATITATNDVTPTNNSADATIDVTAPRVQFDSTGHSVDEAAGPAAITITLDAPNPHAAVSVDVATSDGGAMAGADYTAVSETVTIPAGETSVTTIVPIRDDAIDEGDETVQLDLSSAVGAALGTPDTATLTILDDDTAGVSVNPTSGLTTDEAGGTASFTVTLQSAPTGPVTVTLASDDASEGTVNPGVLVFDAGNWDIPQSATITGLDDAVDDGDVSYTVQTTITSDDPVYDGMMVADVNASNLDDDDAPAETYHTYLPLALVQPPAGLPDLIVRDLAVADNSVMLVIANEGEGPVVDPFWVDVYIDAEPAPTHPNQTWQTLAEEGLVWGVDAGALPLDPGETLTLTVGGAYYDPSESEFSGTIAAGTPVYAQVDSADAGSDYGAVLETHEDTGGVYNNIAGPVTPAAPVTVAGTMPAATDGDGRDARLPERP